MSDYEKFFRRIVEQVVRDYLVSQARAEELVRKYEMKSQMDGWPIGGVKCISYIKLKSLVERELSLS